MQQPPTPPTFVRYPVTFTGTGPQYRRLWTRNTLLLLLTLGLYYPWAMVSKFKYFYSHTLIAGHPLGYHANAAQLFAGNVIATIVLNAVYYGISKTGDYAVVGAAALQILTAALTPLLLQGFLQFQLMHTSWRGQRMGLNASPADAYKSMGAPTLVYTVSGIVAVWAVLAAQAGQIERACWLGLAGTAGLCIGLPFLYYRYKCHQHRHAVFGPLRNEQPLAFNADSTVWTRTALIAILAVFGLVLPLAVALSSQTGFDIRDLGRFSRLSQSHVLSTLMVVGPVLFIGTALMMALPYPYLSVQLQNRLWSQTGHRQLRFESQVPVVPHLKLTARHWGLIVCTLGLYYPQALIIETRARLQAVSVLIMGDVADLLPDPPS